MPHEKEKTRSTMFLKREVNSFSGKKITFLRKKEARGIFAI